MSAPTLSRELSVNVRLSVIQDLLARSSDGVLKRGAINKTAEKFEITRKTVTKYWKRYNDVGMDGNVLDAVKTRKQSHKGERKRDGEELKKAIRALPFRCRRNFRVAARYTSIPSTTLWRYVRNSDNLKRRKSHLRPILTAKNRLQRLRWATEHINPNTMALILGR